MRSPIILVTGKDGQVGWELMRSLAPLGKVVACGRQDVDLANAHQLRDLLRTIKPALIVNPAAYTAVDKAESDISTARAVNATAVAVMAEEAKRLGAAVVHYSTDYVFDGSKAAPYVETDTPSPLNAYGRTKLEGEQALMAAGIPYLCLRTSWVYGIRGANFMRTILRLAQEREELKIVADQIGAPTWSRLIAEATAQILAQCWVKAPDSLADCSGLYHLTAAGETSWYGYAQAILAGVRQLPGWQQRDLAALLPIPSTEYPVPAKRSGYSVLSNQKLNTQFGLSLPDWQDSLDDVLAAMGES
ncbi:dTDP-4-dehydrorhamnose reductase [Chitinivorax tropicus]|uniref:dTDP-4-dehydrorhamnose reductase n=1 Tax=Chitinivorax tropicus TaxID=714531 RepID=A0A840MIT7_9PROT|nr:dTDP-4-dehydrorhamnose reductase [Chitinivorax tropicus]MBB5017109.1 dTDP-4-dehydrorhamnose reductase [Chitinivorax tropicus]